MAGVALRDIYLHFVWQAWHLWHWAGSGGALGFRCGAGGAAAVGVAAVALGDIHLVFMWQASYLVTSTSTSRDRRGTGLHSHVMHSHVTNLWLFTRGAGDAAAVGVAGVALGDIHLRFTWQAWYLVTSTSILRGRRGTYGTGLALVTRLDLGVAPGTSRLLAWQAWHLEISTLVSCGRRGTW